jgi:hypothetical protein
MKRDPAPRAAIRSPARKLATAALLGILLSAVGAWGSFATWARMPAVRMMGPTREAVSAALSAALRSGSPQVIAAYRMRLVADRFPGAIRDRTAVSQLANETARASAGTPGVNSQLPRLQQAATRMLELERDAVAVDDWWPLLEPYLSGLEHASLAHHLGDLVAAWDAAYRSLGAPHAAARRAAEHAIGHPHGPFLQYLCARLTTVTQNREAAGDAGAALTCRRLKYRLLQEWTLAPGPIGLRLLAADLLARELATPRQTAADPLLAAMAADLWGWRIAYTSAAAGRPSTAAPLALGSGVEPAPADAAGALAWLWWSLWLAGAATSAGALALVLVIPAFIASRRTPPPTARDSASNGVVWRALAAAVLVIAAAALWFRLSGLSAADDLRRLWEASLGWPRATLWALPIAAAGVLLAIVTRAGAVARSGRRLEHAARAACAVWVMLVAAYLGVLFVVDRARAAYERATTAAMDDTFTAIAGVDASERLIRLRAWKP